MQTVAQLGFPAGRNSQIAHMINQDLKAKGLIVTGMSAKLYDKLMRMSTTGSPSKMMVSIRMNSTTVMSCLKHKYSNLVT